MSLVGKLVSELEINTSAEKYYKVFKEQPSHVPNISPNIFQQVEIHGGDWDNHGHGSIKTWKYTLDGKDEFFKEQVEYDDEKYTMILNGLGGHPLDRYQTFKLTYQAVPKGLEHSLVIMTLEYEKLDDGSPYPYKYLDIMNRITKDMESHLK